MMLIHKNSSILVNLMIRRKKQTWTLVRSSTPSIFTNSLLPSEIDFSHWSHKTTKIFKLPAEYIHPSKINFNLPTGGVPEIAFVGRSNVGKSSLIDSLFGKSGIVRISKEPGCTRSVNYFGLVKPSGGYEMHLVDLPGYGYAKVSKEDRDSWEKIISEYLKSRDASILRRVFVLIDARRGPKEEDGKMIEFLTKHHITHQVIITKSDLVNEVELQKCATGVMTAIMSKKRHGCMPVIHAVSSVTNGGMAPLMDSIAELHSQKWSSWGGGSGAISKEESADVTANTNATPTSAKTSKSSTSADINQDKKDTKPKAAKDSDGGSDGGSGSGSKTPKSAEDMDEEDRRRQEYVSSLFGDDDDDDGEGEGEEERSESNTVSIGGGEIEQKEMKSAKLADSVKGSKKRDMRDSRKFTANKKSSKSSREFSAKK